MSANTPGQISADGQYYWDGRQWVSTLSPDGSHRWNGNAWAPVAPVAPPEPPLPAADLGPPSGPPSTPAPAWLGLEAPGSQPAAPPPAAPPASMPPPGFVPPPGYMARPAAPNRSGLEWQFGGSAGIAILLGALAVGLPLATMNSGRISFLVITPILGLWRSFTALRAGRTGGAALGFALNGLGGLLSLLVASGTLGGGGT